MIKAVIYDMDGIMIDSEPYWRQAEIEIFKEVNIHLTEEDCLKTLGFRIDEVEDFWFAQYPWNNLPKGAVSEMIVDKMVDYVSSQGEAMKGLKHSLDFFASHGLKLAVASSSHTRLIDAVLSRLQVRSYFSVVCSAENEAFGKPHPAVFISAAKKMNLKTNECLIIEDSPSGIIAARASKAKVIAIPEAHNAHKAEMAIAHVQLNSLEEISQDILNQLQA